MDIVFKLDTLPSYFSVLYYAVLYNEAIHFTVNLDKKFNSF